MKDKNKKNKNIKKLIYIILGLVFVLAIIIYLFVIHKKDNSGVEECDQVFTVYVSAINNRDIDKLYSLWPDELRIKENYDIASKNLEDFEKQNIMLDDAGISEKSKLTSADIKEIESKIKEIYGKRVSISDAYYITYTYYVIYDGIRYDDCRSSALTVIKIGQKWYMYE